MMAHNKGEHNDFGIGIIAKQIDGCLIKIVFWTISKGQIIPASVSRLRGS